VFVLDLPRCVFSALLKAGQDSAGEELDEPREDSPPRLDQFIQVLALHEPGLLEQRTELHIVGPIDQLGFGQGARSP
jgi:hypothetical protein